VDHLISELEQRFEGHTATGMKLQSLLPAYCTQSSFVDIADRVEFYSLDLDGSGQVEGEFDIWKRKWAKIAESERPRTAIETLSAVPELNSLFPNIAILITIFGILPVTTSTAERTFSTLRRLKSYMRSTMGETRLTGLTLMSIHRNRKIDIDRVIDNLALRKTCRLKFLL
jgi:hypothetical protein